MAEPDGRRIETAVFFSRWLVAPFLFGLVCCLALIVCRFFLDLFNLSLQLVSLTWHDLVVGVLNLVDLSLTANLVLIVIFSAYENYIRKVEAEDHPDWPPGLTNVDFGALKQKLLGSITGIASVESLAWYLDLEKYSDTSKLVWAIVFPLMFVVAMLVLAIADWLGRESGRGTE